MPMPFMEPTTPVRKLAIVHGRKGYHRAAAEDYRPYMVQGRDFGCKDGMGAAYAVWKYDPEYLIFPTNYGEEFPWTLIDENTEVLIGDFSYDRKTIEEANSIVKSLVLLDHHETSEATLGDLEYCFFDKMKCGAVMMWEFLHEGKEIPKLLMEIQNNDLGHTEGNKSAEIVSGYNSLEQCNHLEVFDTWTNCDLSALETIGDHIAVQQRREVAEIMKSKVYGIKHIEGHTVAVINKSGPINHILSALLEAKTGSGRKVDYAMSYFVTPRGAALFQLRSDGREHVGKIATKLFPGGGGHRQAAGGELKFPMSTSFLSDIYATDQH